MDNFVGKPVIEVEKRGLLSAKQKQSFLNFLKSKARFIRECNQLTVFCETSGDLLGTIDKAKARISIGIVKNFALEKVNCTLKAKLGKMESQSRKEIEIPFSFQLLNSVFAFLNIFGINSGCPRFYHRIDYQYQNFIISVKDQGLIPDHFEIETTVKSKTKIRKSYKDIEAFAKLQGLKIFTEAEYKKLMLGLYRDNPPVPFEKIDLSAIVSK